MRVGCFVIAIVFSSSALTRLWLPWKPSASHLPGPLATQLLPKAIFSKGNVTAPSASPPPRPLATTPLPKASVGRGNVTARSASPPPRPLATTPLPKAIAGKRSRTACDDPAAYYVESEMVANSTSPFKTGVLKSARCDWWTLVDDNRSLPAWATCGRRLRYQPQFSMLQYRYTGPGAGGTPRDLETALGRRHVILVGDSMGQQLWAPLKCYMTGNWTSFADASRQERIDHVNATLLKYGCQLGRKLAQDIIPTWWDEVNTSLGGRLEFYGMNGMQLPNRLLLIEYLTKVPSADLVIFNFGVWFATPQSLRERLEWVMQLCQRHKAKCAFRESFGQHFHTPTGTGVYQDVFRDPVTHRWSECGRYIWRTYDWGADWRTRAIEDAAKKTGYNISGLVWKVFEALMPRGDVHQTIDCTHFGMHDTNEAQIVPLFWEPCFLSLTDMLHRLSGTT